MLYNTKPIQSIFRSNLKRMMFSFNYVKFTMCKEIRTNAKLPDNADQQQWPLNQILNGFCKMRALDIDSNLIYIQDPKEILSLRRVKVYSGNEYPKPSLVPIAYYSNQNSYTFMFKMNSKHWFFVKVSVETLI